MRYDANGGASEGMDAKTYDPGLWGGAVRARERTAERRTISWALFAGEAVACLLALG